MKITTQAPPPVPQPPRTHTLGGLTDAQLGLITALLGRATRPDTPACPYEVWDKLAVYCDDLGIPRHIEDFSGLSATGEAMKR